MASIRKRGNSYQITVSKGRDQTGKQLLETTTFVPDAQRTKKQNQKALERFVYEFEQKVLSGKYLDGEKASLDHFAKVWFTEYAEQHLAPTTIDTYQFLYRIHISPAIGNLKLAKIQPLHLNKLYNSMLKTRKDGKAGGYSPTTIKRVHALLSSMFSTAVQWNILLENPCDRVSPPKQARSSSDIKFFTVEQCTAFLGAVDAQVEAGQLTLQHKVLFNLAVFCGLRRGELIALEWSDVNFDQSTISVTKNTVIVGKQVITKEPKNTSSIRVVSVPTSVMQLLRSYKKEQQKLRLSLGKYWKGSNYIFIQSDGTQMYPSTPYETMKNVIHRYNDSAAEPLPDIPFHGLRHTSATLLIGTGTDVRTVSNRLGHAQTSTTMNIYAHSLTELDRAAADNLDNLLKEKTS